jgi:hypothetical protein
LFLVDGCFDVVFVLIDSIDRESFVLEIFQMNGGEKFGRFCGRALVCSNSSAFSRKPTGLGASFSVCTFVYVNRAAPEKMRRF